VPRGDVVAAAAFTGFSMGVWGTNRGPRRCSCVSTRSGRVRQGACRGLPPDPANSVFAIPDCFFVLG
jgi:hypothetical protein